MAASDAEIKVTAALDDKVSAQVRELVELLGKLDEEGKKGFVETAKAVNDLSAKLSAVKKASDDVGKATEAAGKKAKESGRQAEEGAKQGEEAFKNWAATVISLSAVLATVIRDLKSVFTQSQSLDEVLARLTNELDGNATAAAKLGQEVENLRDDFKFQVDEAELLGVALKSLEDNITDTSNAANFAGNAFVLARSANISLSDSYKVLSDATRIFGLESDASYDTANLLFRAAKDGAASVQDLGNAVVAIGPQAKALGLSFSDALTAISTLTKTAGFDGPKAITTLDRVLDTLSKRSVEIEEQFNKTGRSLQSVNVSSLGLFYALQNLVDGYQGSEGELRKLLGSTDAYNAVIGLTGKNLASVIKSQGDLALGNAELLTSFQRVQREIGAEDIFADYFLQPVGAYRDVVGALDNVGRGLSNLGKEARAASLEQANLRKEQLRSQYDAQQSAVAAQDLAAGIVAARQAAADASPGFQDFTNKVRDLGTELTPSQRQLRQIEDTASDLKDELKKLSETTGISSAAYEKALKEIEDARIKAIDNVVEAEKQGVLTALAKESEARKKAREARIAEETKTAETIAAKEAAIAEEREKDEAVRLDRLRALRVKFADEVARAIESVEPKTSAKDFILEDVAAFRDLRDEAKELSALEVVFTADKFLSEKEAIILAARLGELQRKAGELAPFLESEAVRLERLAERRQALSQELTRGIEVGEVRLIEEQSLLQLRSSIEPLAEELALLEESFLADGILSDEEALLLAERFAQIQRAVRDLSYEARQGTELIGEGFVAALQDRARPALDQFAEGVKLGNAVFDGFTNNLADAFTAIVTGTKTASEAFKDFIRNFIINIVSAINQIIAFKIALAAINFATSFGAVGPGGGLNAEIVATPGIGSVPAYELGGIATGEMLDSLPIRAYAKGGIANSPQLAVFGEGSGAEAFVPLPGPNRGIPVEFSNFPMPEQSRSEQAAPSVTVSVNYNPNVQALDGRGAREVLLREARIIGDIVAGEIASGANRGLVEVVRGRGGNA